MLYSGIACTNCAVRTLCSLTNSLLKNRVDAPESIIAVIVFDRFLPSSVTSICNCSDSVSISGTVVANILNRFETQGASPDTAAAARFKNPPLLLLYLWPSLPFAIGVSLCPRQKQQSVGQHRPASFPLWEPQ